MPSSLSHCQRWPSKSGAGWISGHVGQRMRLFKQKWVGLSSVRKTLADTPIFCATLFIPTKHFIMQFTVSMLEQLSSYSNMLREKKNWFQRQVAVKLHKRARTVFTLSYIFGTAVVATTMLCWECVLCHTMQLSSKGSSCLPKLGQCGALSECAQNTQMSSGFLASNSAD